MLLPGCQVWGKSLTLPRPISASLYNEWVFWGNFSGFFQFQTPFLSISNLLPHFCLEWNVCLVCIHVSQGTWHSRSPLVWGHQMPSPQCAPSPPQVVGGDPGPGLLQAGGPGQAQRLVAARHQPFLPALLFFQPFVLSYVPALNSLLAKRISSISKEMSTKQFWYFLSPLLSCGL